MASQEILEQLFEVAKISSSFKGMKEKDIWEACLSYKDRGDKDIEIAIENILKKDEKEAKKAESRQALISENKEKIKIMHEKEEKDHANDVEKAEKMLAELFNS